MATNKEIKHKEKFVDANRKFEDAIRIYREELNFFKKNTGEKQLYVDERADSWHEKENNQLFKKYMLDTGDYIDDVEDVLNEFSILTLPDLDKYERQETSDSND